MGPERLAALAANFVFAAVIAFVLVRVAAVIRLSLSPSRRAGEGGPNVPPETGADR